MKKFREFLIEKESPCQVLFNKEIFGWLTKEINTNKEDLVYDKVVRDYFSDNDINKAVVRSFQALKKCQKNYPEALNTKNGISVYRGLDRSKNNMKILKTANFTKEWKGFYVADYIYKPHREIQSFSTSWRVASGFSYGDFATDERIPLIFETKTTDDFIFTEKFTKWIDNRAGINDEKEITRVSKKPIKGQIYVKKSVYNQIMKRDK